MTDGQAPDGLVRTPCCPICGEYYQPPIQSDECPHVNYSVLVPRVSQLQIERSSLTWEEYAEKLLYEIERLRARVAELESRDLCP